MVSTKSTPKVPSKTSVEANLGNINHDLKLIESFIELRNELNRKLYVTPEILRHGHAVEVKPKAKCFKARLDYEQREKERERTAWRSGEKEPEKPVGYSKQQFLMTSKGQIRSKANKNLVLGAKPGSLNEFESGGQIYLVYKAQDDPGQFFVQKGRYLCLTYNPTLVLAVSDGKLILQTRSSCDNGAANQLFKFDRDGGLMANQGDEMNIEITACCRTKICTYTVTGPESVQQAGYYESGLTFCSVCGPLLPGRIGLNKNVREFSCVMGEAETDPEAPRISPFKFIPRPKLQGENAVTAQEDVQKIIDEARDKINEAPAPIQIKMCKNHFSEKTGKVIQIRSMEEIHAQAKKLYNIECKRVYTPKGKLIFNFDQITCLASDTGTATIWVSNGDGFSNVESHLEATQFVKDIDKKQVYSQGPQWKKVLVTANRKLSTPPQPIQGRSMEELLKAARLRLGLHTEVEYFIDEKKNKITTFEDVPLIKDQSEMSLNVLEIYYKFKNTNIRSREDQIKSEKSKGTKVVLGSSYTNQKATVQPAETA